MNAAIDRLTTALADRYRLERELGAGGMATVYLAEDLKHRRKVAIKVLHAELSALLGPERFLKEIELTANLQHPHILPLFDSGNAEGLLYYVMPYVEGETLRDRLSRDKQLAIAEAVRIASEAADALAYAHGRGIVHRDIKPENILLQNGHALVADFGIALAVQQAGGERMTQTGLSLGTPQYMSPEQAMGEREIGLRSDIYSLGAVTYEMLAGEPPFTGPTAQAIVAQVITSEPRSLTARRKSIPSYVDDAVMTALEKLPADRFASASQFAEALAGGHVLPRADARRPRGAQQRSVRAPILAVTTVALAAVALAGWMLTHRASSVHTLQASLLPPAGCSYDRVALDNLVQMSNDGSTVAFVATCGERSSIWLRSLVTGALTQLPGTAQASYPFWSPDGGSIGFFAGGRLKRIDLRDNAVRDLAAAPQGRGGSWNQEDVILYAPDITGPIYQIPAAGGVPRPATSVKRGHRVTDRLPYFLPDGQHFLFSSSPLYLGAFAGSVRVGQLGSTDSRVLIDNPSNVAYADGHLLYARAGLLIAQPFNPRSATFTGAAVSIAPNLENWVFKDIASFSVSQTGALLVYRRAPAELNRVSWFDPATGAVTTLFDPGSYAEPRVSPDGQQILMSRAQPDNSLRDVWLYDTAARTWSRISTHPSIYYSFSWSPDGTRIAYESAIDSTITVLPLDRSATRTFTVSARDGDFVLDWAPDGSLIGARQAHRTGWNIMRTTLSGGTAQARDLVATSADEGSPRVSPDGALLAYASTETGRFEVYVARMADVAARWQVSQTGVEYGFQTPVGAVAWNRRGDVLYFANRSGQLLSVTVSEHPAVRIGRPTLVAGAPSHIVGLDAAPDGRLLIVSDESRTQQPLQLVEHWSVLAKKAR